MASPLTKRQTSGHIDSIKTSKLIKLVQNHVLDGVKVEKSRLTYAMRLLAKTLPDQRCIDMQLDVDGELNITVLQYSESNDT